MQYATQRPYADPEKAARKLLEIASTIEPVQDGRIYIELLNGAFLFGHGGSPAEYGAGLSRLNGVGCGSTRPELSFDLLRRVQTCSRKAPSVRNR
jgi:hypothetical protein